MSTYSFEKYGIDLFTYGKTQCPKCAAGGRDANKDNLMVYGEDREGKHKGAYCWSCSFTIPSEEWLEEHGEIQEEVYEYMGALFNSEIHAKLKANTTTNPRGYRGLLSDVTSYFGVRHEIDGESGKVTSQYYPATQAAPDLDAGYKLSGYKRRIDPKDFSKPLGETGRDCHLFGQFRFLQDRGRDVLIVGGELDQLSAYQMLKEATDKKNARNGSDWPAVPVVSPTIGESGAYKQIQLQYDWLNRFERIIVCMDNDAAGRKATEAICKLLPKGKAYIMTLSLKDPNSYIWDKDRGVSVNRANEFVSAFYKTQPYTPSGIVGSGSLMDLIKAAAVVPKIPLPPFMHKVQRMMAGGIPLKTITNLGSASGTGKSTMVDECVYYWVFNSPHKVGVVSLESDCAQYGTKILSRHIGKKLDLIEDDDYKLDLLNSAEVDSAAKELFYNTDGSHRWHLIEERDGGLDSLKELIMTLIIACECKVIILDPLQDILDGLSIDEQAVFMKWMKGTLKSHDVAFILINHVRKSGNSGKANSTGADLHEEDFQGSSSIFKSAACNLLFTRNKEAESELERNTTVMKMTKCRWTGQTSPVAGKFYYDNNAHRLYDLDDYLKAHPELYVQMEDE
ncbi:hypothetical protein D3C84_247500 [compost metagenome]